MDYTEAQLKTITDSGFRVNAAGKIMNAEGRLVSQAMAEQVVAGNMLSNFSMDELRKKKARKAATGTTDLISTLREMSPAIELLAVGQTAKIAIPKVAAKEGKDPKRSFVMGITTKLNNVTMKGREWAGRVFDTASDDTGEFVYVARLPDTDAPRTRKAPSPRSAGSSQSADDRLKAAMAETAEALDDDNSEANTNEDTAETTDAVLEDAVVVQH